MPRPRRRHGRDVDGAEPVAAGADDVQRHAGRPAAARACSRIASRKPTISSTVSPLARSATRNPASCAWVDGARHDLLHAHVRLRTLRSSPSSRVVRISGQVWSSRHDANPRRREFTADSAAGALRTGFRVPLSPLDARIRCPRDAKTQRADFSHNGERDEHLSDLLAGHARPYQATRPGRCRHDRLARQRGDVLRGPLRDLLHPPQRRRPTVGARDPAAERPVRADQHDRPRALVGHLPVRRLRRRAVAAVLDEGVEARLGHGRVVLAHLRAWARSSSPARSGSTRSSSPRASRSPRTPTASAFYLTTGFHALHVTGGLIAFLLVIGRVFAVKNFGHKEVTSADRRLVLLALRRRRLDRPVPRHLLPEIEQELLPNHAPRTKHRAPLEPTPPAAGARSPPSRSSRIGLADHRRRYAGAIRGIGRRPRPSRRRRSRSRRARSSSRRTAPPATASMLQGTRQRPVPDRRRRAAVDFQVGTGRMPMADAGPAGAAEAAAVHRRADPGARGLRRLARPRPRHPRRELLDGDGDAGHGAELFRINCAMCHNVAGAGGALTEGKYAPALTMTQRVHIYEAMVTGPQNMPVFNDLNLSPEDKRDIISSLMFLQDNRVARRFRARLARAGLGGPVHLDLRLGADRRDHRVDHGEVQLIAHGTQQRTRSTMAPRTTRYEHREGLRGSPRPGSPSRSPDPRADPGFPPHRQRITDKDPGAMKHAVRTVYTLFYLSVAASIWAIAAYMLFPIESGTIVDIRNNNLFIGLGIALALLAHRHRRDPLVEVDHVRQGVRRAPSRRRAVATRPARPPSQASPTPTRSPGFGRRIADPQLDDRRASSPPSLPARRAVPRARARGPRTRSSCSATRCGRRARASRTTPRARRSAPPTSPSARRSTSSPRRWPNSSTRRATSRRRPRPSSCSCASLPERAQRDARARADWSYDGIVAYSKVCTHVGCPVALYEQQTHHLLCPCHQSQFDVANGAAVIFGPAARPLPQLPITVDDEGYLVARSDFTEPVGPSFWERH